MYTGIAFLFSLCQEKWILWYEATLRAEAKFLTDLFCASSAEEATLEKPMASLFTQLVGTLTSFAWPESIRSSLPEAAAVTLRQASTLLLFVEKFYSKATGSEEWQTADFEELEKVCGDFKMDPGWAGVCCRKGSVEDFQRQFAVDFTTKYYPVAERSKAFAFLVQMHGAQDKLENFVKSVPESYSFLLLPSSYEELDVADLCVVSSTIGDKQLQQQLQYLCSAHTLLTLASKCAALRAESLEIGAAGGETPLHADAITALQATRDNLKCFLAVASSCQACFQPAGLSRHMDDLDNYLAPAEFTSFVQNKVGAELVIWGSAWTQQCKEIAERICKNIPAGWQAKKNAILRADSADAKKSLLQNPQFAVLSTDVAAMSSALILFRKMSAPPLIGCEMLNDARKAAAAGTETVSIAYAIFMLESVIPKATNKKTEVEKLRADMNAKRVSLGTDLEAEAERLESS